jgi:DeoR family transcriptional regulator, suf operon transcriptional repressor
MSIQAPTSDAGLLDLLRITGPLGVSELADAMEVTPTAVRQRLVRLLAQSAIQREATRHGRGRPKHRYWLTEKGVRLTGSNFTDLAVTLWQEIRQSSDPELRRETLRRIARALALGYAEQIEGETPAERMHSLAELLAQRRIPVSVENSSRGTVLTEHACPYPKLAEQDQGICSVERMMFSELLGQNVELTQCRLQGGSECRFQAS